MDLLEIDSTTWKPVGDTIKHYDSLIWTERYLEDGDFELKTKAVEYTRKRMPIESCVAIHQSREVMQVEQHSIDTDAKGFETLTIKGRSLTMFTKYRAVGYKRTEKYKVPPSLTNLDAGLLLLFDALASPGDWDYTRGVSAAGVKSAKDRISNMIITDSTAEETTGNPGAVRKRWIQPGPVDPVLRKFINRKPYGLRMWRPPRTGAPFGDPDNFLAIDVSQAVAISRDNTVSTQDLCFDVYLGRDLSHTSGVSEPVIFDTEIDDLILPNYVQTIADFKSQAHIVVDEGVLIAYSDQNDPNDNTTPQNLSGIRRRILYLDGGQAEEGYTVSEWHEHNIDEAENTLSSMKRQSLIDGEVSPISRLKFGHDYNLGDLVSVRGRYSPLSRARVTEYIRTDDEKGEESYPALTYI